MQLIGGPFRSLSVFGECRSQLQRQLSWWYHTIPYQCNSGWFISPSSACCNRGLERVLSRISTFLVTNAQHGHLVDLVISPAAGLEESSIVMHPSDLLDQFDHGSYKGNLTKISHPGIWYLMEFTMDVPWPGLTARG